MLNHVRYVAQPMIVCADWSDTAGALLRYPWWAIRIEDIQWITWHIAPFITVETYMVKRCQSRQRMIGPVSSHRHHRMCDLKKVCTHAMAECLLTGLSIAQNRMERFQGTQATPTHPLARQNTAEPHIRAHSSQNRWTNGIPLQASWRQESTDQLFHHSLLH